MQRPVGQDGSIRASASAIVPASRCRQPTAWFEVPYGRIKSIRDPHEEHHQRHYEEDRKKFLHTGGIGESHTATVRRTAPSDKRSRAPESPDL